MISTVLEVVALACFAAAAFLLAGTPAALIVAGVSLLLVALALDGVKVSVTVPERLRRRGR